MFRIFRAVSGHLQNPMVFSPCHQKWIHSRNKKAMEFVAKGWSALQEVERVNDYAALNDPRLIPQLRTAKENFELALEVDNSNTHARYWLSRLHLKYQNHAPGACPAIGAALLAEAADMGDADALYEVGCQLRIKDELGNSAQEAFYYIEKAVDQLHPGALYLLGAVHLAGDCVRKDVASAIWCFHRASEKGHAGAAIAYGSLLLKGAEIPEAITKFHTWKGRIGSQRRRKVELPWEERLQMAMDQFAIAAKAGCELGFRWLSLLEDEKMRLLEGATGESQDSLPMPT